MTIPTREVQSVLSRVGSWRRLFERNWWVRGHGGWFGVSES